MSTTHSIKRATLIAVLGLCTAGCGRSETAASRAIAITTAAVPSRYAAPLPTTSAALERWLRHESSDIAPVSHVVDSVLTGNPAWLARLKSAADAVAEADRGAWVRSWAKLFQYEEAVQSFCSQTRAAMGGASSVFRDVISLPFARSCLSASDTALVLREDTPSRAVLEYYDSRVGLEGVKPAPFDPLLVEAARDVIVDGDAFEARMAAFTLIGTNDARADAALLAIHSSLNDRARADVVALAFFWSRNDEGRARARTACGRIPRDAMCDSPAEPLADDPDDEAGEETVSAATVKARIEQLADIGFAKVGIVNAAELSSDAAEEILLAAGHAHWFDVETDAYPNQHDSLMRYLAALVSPDLDEAVFEEIAPEIDDETEPYDLLAYSNGKLLRSEAQNLGDWYDLGAVLELMNAIMVDRNHPVRFTVLATGDQTAIVVAAQPSVLARAVKAGLLELADPTEAEKAGKEFEERVLESLQD